MLDESAIRTKMQGAVDLAQKEASQIRTGRATGSLVENIDVPAYGGTQHLKVQELGTISTPDPETIVIDPWDKSIIGDIKKGIDIANIGYTPNIDGEVIRIKIPPLTTEDREKFVKLLAGKIEQIKIILRQVRADELKEIRQRFENKDITEDDKFTQEKRLQELTDEYMEKIEKIESSKTSELMGK